jgi:ubiquinone/menaquinone biosynthesis C-methylase UbiE
MNCDAIAAAYRWLEYAVFGRKLENSRFAFLNVAAGRQRALLVGDGDGRFLVRLAAAHPQLEIDSIELSGKMIGLAKQRIHTAKLADPSRIRFIHADVRAVKLAPARYDLVAMNFLLDCFQADELSCIVRRIKHACLPQAAWMVAEFQQPSSGWRAWHAFVWLRTMYLFFRFAAQLETQSLPPYEQILRNAGFHLMAKHTSRAELISSALWNLSAQLPSEL